MQNATPNNATRIPVFTGEDGQFPFYKMRFMAVVCGLSNHHHAAIAGLPPYDQMSYSNGAIPLSPFKTPRRPRTTATLQTPQTPPTTASGGEDKAQHKEEDAEATADLNRENYHQISRQVFSILISSIGEEPLKRLVNAGMKQFDGIGAWNLLCREYENGTSVNQRRLFNELINLKMESELAKLHDYLYAFRRITTTLSGMDIELPEQLLISILLAGLSTDYGQIINILNSMADLTLDTCMAQLKTFQATNEIDTKRTEMSGYSGQQQTTTTGSPGHRIQGNRRRGMLACYNCNKTHMGGEFECQQPCKVCGSTSHVRFNCPDKGKRRQERKQERTSNSRAQGDAAQGNAAIVDQLSAQLSKLLGAALAAAPINQPPDGNGGSVEWGMDDLNLHGAARR